MNEDQLSKLSPRHQQIARLLVSGHTQTEIAQMMGCNKSTICRHSRDPLVLQEVKRLQEKAEAKTVEGVPGVTEKLRNGAHRGLEVLLQILEDPSTQIEMIKLKANVALELLSRAGYGPIKQMAIDQRVLSAHLTAEDIEEIKERAREAGIVEFSSISES